ncbi:MAG: glycosyltransferase [Acidobacteriota bacterium]|nr:glycosyltransferase [Acidobacteriota bacterium]
MPNRELKNLKPKILVLCDYYLPGYKSGGGMRTIANMVECFHDIYDFWIITRDHDGKLERQPYRNVKINEWNNVHYGKVFYLSRDKIKISKLHELILQVKPNIVYFNSFFATLTIYCLILQRLKLIPNINTILAPCGELSVGGLSLKSIKKKVFISFAKISKIYRNVIWKASSKLEKNEIKRTLSNGEKIFIAADIPPKTILSDFDLSSKPRKVSGKARLIFLSRFVRKKNFKFLIENMDKIKGDLLIDVWGPLEDLQYWEECSKIIKKLPLNIKVEAKGAIPYEQVTNKLLEYHFFVLPTLGENFGYVFLEALAAGCPLLISDQTPWMNLEEKGIGWEISLDKTEKWQEILNTIISLDTDSYNKLSHKSRRFAETWLADGSIINDTKKVLDYALENTLIKTI